MCPSHYPVVSSKIVMKHGGKLGLIIKHGDVSNVVVKVINNNVPNMGDCPDFFPKNIEFISTEASNRSGRSLRCS